MKKYIKYLLSLAVVFSVASCTKTVTLDDSVDNRLNKVINGYIEELSASENGWLLNLMTDEGIYRFWMDFTDNNVVTMYTDNIHYPEYKNKPQTSTYNIRALLLPTLSFDTYSYIHIPNDPDNNVSFGTDENMGLNTDFEFEIDAYEDGVFSLTGRISRVEASLTRATAADKEAVKQGGLMDVLLQAKSYKKGQFLCTKIGGTDIGVRFNPDPRKVMLTWKDADGTANNVNAYTYSNLNHDVILNEPAMVNGATISAFRWDDSSKTYTAEMPDGTTSPVIAQDTPVVSLYDMLGGGKAFSTMISVYDMYADEDMTDEQVQEIAKNNNFFSGYLALAKVVPTFFIYDSELASVQIEFYNSDKGLPRIMVTPVMYIYLPEGGYQPVGLPYSFQLTVNDAKEQITLGVTATGESEDAKYFATAVKPLLDVFKSKTFQVEWSQLDYSTELMGQLRLIPSGSEGNSMIYGAIFE